MSDETTRYGFEVTGGFSVRKDLVPEPNAIGGIRGFKLPDGRVALPIVALEIEAADGASYEYVTSEKEMSELGMEGLDYAHLYFHELFEEE